MINEEQREEDREREQEQDAEEHQGEELGRGERAPAREPRLRLQRGRRKRAGSGFTVVVRSKL